jgi:hypothetical protein
MPSYRGCRRLYLDGQSHRQGSLVFLRPRLLIVSLGLFLPACANPLWRFDDFKLDVTVSGTQCSVLLNGKPFGDPDYPRVVVVQDNEGANGYPAPQSTVTFICGGVGVSIVAPAGPIPGRGAYAVSYGDGAPHDSVAVVSFRHRDLPRGFWPTASSGGVELHGTSGSLRIERMRGDTVFATIVARAQRAPLQP